MIALLLAAQILTPQVDVPKTAARSVAEIPTAPPPELKVSAPRRVVVTAPPLPPMDRMPVLGLGSDCKDPQVRVVDPRWRPQVFTPPPRSTQPRTLRDQPPAAHELAVDRKLNGCRVRTVVSWPQN